MQAAAPTFRPSRTTTEFVTLWDTWLVFGLVVGLLLAERVARKGVNLARVSFGTRGEPGPAMAFSPCLGSRPTE